MGVCKDFMIANDAAFSEWKGNKIGEYILPKSGKKFTTDELIAHWKMLGGKISNCFFRRWS